MLIKNRLILPLLVCITCVIARDFGRQALAQSNQELLNQEQSAFMAAAREGGQCVVQIETFGGLERVGQELIAEGPTTGTIVAPDGWIISTLFSLRQKPASILVALPDGTRAPARIIARDYSRELALLKIDGYPDLPFATPSRLLTEPPSQLVGRWVLALGKTYDKLQASQSIGIISAVGRAYDRAIQTDAKISPINYGGPLVDLDGRILGILSPLSPGAFLEGDSTQIYDSGIGFAIPLQDILERLPRMQAGEDVRQGKLGIVPSEQNEFAGPVSIVGAMPGSPAAKAGVQAGDLLVTAQGKPVRILADLRHALGPVDAGSEFRFSVERDGQQVDLQVELTDEIPIYRRRYLGLRLRPSGDAGLEILAVEPDSPASATKLTSGMTIVSCNGKALESAEELRSLIAVAELDTPLVLSVTGEQDQMVDMALTPTTWPDGIARDMPAKAEGMNDSLTTSFVDVNVGDFPNKAYALVPPLANERSLGILIIFPEPGSLEREKVKAIWGNFARDYGWIVAVINSGNPQRWSPEELQLAGRVLGRMKNGYTIDKARTVLGGLGVGGRMALLAAGMQPDKISAVMTIGTDFGRLRAGSRNSPLQSIDYLLVGDSEALTAAAENLKQNGYAAEILPGNGLEPQKLETHPQEQLELWLEGLARF